MTTDRAAERASTPMTELVLGQLRGLRPVSPGVLTDRRTTTERRRLTPWSVIYGGFRPRRRRARRIGDMALPVLDWHESHLLVAALAILLLCVADAFLTLNLLLVGATELNPIMAKLISIDATLFTVAKMALTGAGILVLVLLSKFRLFGRIPVAQGLYVVLVIYVLLVLYELTLLSSLF